MRSGGASGSASGDAPDGATTVVTPNRRLAQTLAAEFDRRQQASGRTVWETADVLPYGAFVERLYDDALHSDLAAGLPLLLTPDQEQSLWEDVLRRSGIGDALLAIPEAATLAREAWTLAHAWDLADGLPGTLAGDDAVAFAGWARDYAAWTGREHVTDRARLPAVAAAALGEPRVRKPPRLVAYGFDAFTPQQGALFRALAARGTALARCAPPQRAADAIRVTAADARAEFALAARWARARLEVNPAARIAIVVPELHRHKRGLRRALAETMDPGRAGGVLPFNVSLGDPLAGFPLVAHALAALELAGRETPFEQASRVIRSPFLALAESEAQARARGDAWLRRRAEPTVTLDRLAALLTDGGALAERLRAYADFRKQLFDARSPADWARGFGDALALLGFPGERGLASDEYQALQKWHEVLARLAALERVAPRMGFEAALARLTRMAGETLFQPETPAVPIQVLGVLEAAGMAFDHLWVTGLTDEAWPPAPNPNPFLPLRLQRVAGIPNATPATALAFAQRLTGEWLTGADEVVLSHPLREGDRDLAPSPLIASFAETAPALPEYGSWRNAIHRSASIERVLDAQAPALAAGGRSRGGTGLLKDQAACPFRAFARRRLAAGPIEAPHAGLDAMERGTLVHRVLEAVWRKLGTKRALEALPAAERDALIARAVEEAIADARTRRPTTLRGRFAAIERGRLARLADDWLEIDCGREAFTVLPVEEKRAVVVGPLALAVRLDRVDETASGERIVIDYKTGTPVLASILRARLDEPQLPIYATAAEPGAAAAAFAQVRSREMKFVGLARLEGLLPGVGTPAQAGSRSGAQADWNAQVAFWRGELERLAVEFASGRADVAPKKGLQTCRECDLQPLCRIHERLETGVGEE